MSDQPDFSDVVKALHDLHDAELAAAEGTPSPLRKVRRTGLVGPAASLVAIVLVLAIALLAASWLRPINVANPSPSAPPTAVPSAMSTETPSAEPSPPPVSTPSTPSGPTPTPSVEPSPTPTAEPVVDLTAGAWVFADNYDTTGGQGHAVRFGRLDGRVFVLTAPSSVSASRPADNGRAIAWWRDPVTMEWVVVLLDTGTGDVTELSRVSSDVFIATIAPSGYEWYWIPSTIKQPAADMPLATPQGLWRQNLYGGKAQKVADINDGAAANVTGLDFSVDGNALLITRSEPSTDYSPYHYLVWYAIAMRLTTVPTVELEPIGIWNDSIVAKNVPGAPGQQGVFAIDLFGLPTSAIPFTVPPSDLGIFEGADGAAHLVYAATNGQGLVALFEHQFKTPLDRQILDTGEAPTTDSGPRLQSSIGPYGGVNFVGWVPFLPYSSQYVGGILPEDARGVPSRVVNIEDGTIVTLPTLRPVEQVLLPGQ